MDSEQLLTHSLRALPWGAAAARVLAAALAAVEPAAAVRRHLRRDGDTLLVGHRAYDLRRYDRALLLAVGKAAAPMAQAAAEALGDRLAGGLVVMKGGQGGPVAATDEGRRTNDQGRGATDHGSADQQAPLVFGLSSSVRVIEAGHPVPDERSAAAGRAAAELLSGAVERDLVLLLISGGGSSLLTLPAPGVALADMQGLTRALLACGASINEINTLRKHLDLVKGGGLARMAHPAALAALVLSDVVGNPLDVIASGPAVADTSSFADAWAVVERYGLADQIPPAVAAHLRRGLAGDVPDTPKPGDPALAQVAHVLVGSNRQAADAALAQARAEGFAPLLLTTFLQGEAREAGRTLAAIAREVAATGSPASRPACIVAGGETTVTLRGAGRGGRNQELALGAAADMAGLPGAALIALATDGDDGPTAAAGAVVTGETMARAAALGLSPADALARNDSYPFFAALGDLLLPGMTGTNVNDLAFVFVG